MNTLKRFEKYLELVRKCYIIAFITYLLLSRVVMFVNIISLPVNGLIYNILAVAGIGILVWDFFTNFYQFKSIENIILLIFLGVCGISSLLNIEYGLSSNLKTMAWMAIQFFVLFSTLHIKDKSYIKDVINKLMKIISTVWFITSAISLFQFFFVIKYKAPFSSYARRQGFVDSRLFGIYSDPNFAAVTSLIVIIFAFFLCKNAKTKGYKRFNIVNIAVQILYIILSGSRTGQIELVFVLAVLTVIFARNKNISVAKKKYELKAFLTAGIVVIITVVGINVLPRPLISIAKVGENIKEQLFSEEKPGEAGDDDEKEDDDDEEITLDREDVKEDDISNNRFDIWKSAIEVSNNARLFGVSPRNMVAYAKANYPDSYIATSEYETHNGYLAVFVYSGFLGTAVMLAFVGYMAYLFFKYLKSSRHKVYGDEIMVCLSTVIIVAISSVMLLDIFFVNTVSAALFWLMAGYFVYLAKSETDK